MAITNTSKPGVASITNSTRVAVGETWGTIITTWASETSTWEGLASFFTNTAKVTPAITNTVKPS